MSPKTTAIFLLRLDSRRFLGGCDFQATCYNRHLVDTEVLTSDRQIFFKWNNKSIVFHFILVPNTFVRLIQMWVKKGVILMARINTWLLKMHQNALFMNLR